MGHIGNEIVQSRMYQDPNPPAPPSKNYKYTFPITVYDAVRRSMNDADSTTLTEDIDNIYKELRSKQSMIPSLPANYLVTYGGRAGAIGSIKITESISWDPEKWSNNLIPTEKAVGDLLFRYGILDRDPDKPSEELKKIIWSDIVGRPTIYDCLGNDKEGLINQEALTKIIKEIQSDISKSNTNWLEKFSQISLDLKDHIDRTDNPHNVTLEQLGAASKSILDNHLNNFNNPHNVTLEQLGIPNVDNTSDKDKPISDATQEAIDRLASMIDGLSGSMGLMNFVTRIEYNQRTGRLDAIYTDGSRLGVTIVTDGLVDEIQFDEKKHILKVIELNGKVTKIPLDVLYNKYIGSEGTHIIVEIDEDNVVKATIIPKSITSDEIADKSIKTNVIANEAVTGDKIKDCTITTIKYANHSVTSEKIAKGGVEEVNIKDRAVTGEKLFTSTVDNRVLAVRTGSTNPQWTQIVGEMIAREVIGTRHIIDESITEEKLNEYAVTESRIHDNAVTTRKIQDLGVTTEKIADDAVTTEKIAEDILLRGIPRMTGRPDITAEDNELVDAGWVRKVLDKNTVTDKNIGRRVVNGRHLFSSKIKNRALIVTEVDGDSYWGQINHEMIEDEAVETPNIKDLAITSEKIKDYAIISRHIGIDSVSTVHIQNGAIQSEKIYTSEEANRVLAAVTENGHPLYTQVTNPMIAKDAVGTEKIADQSITLSKFAKREAEGNTVLAFLLQDHDPVWTKIITELIAKGAVTSSKLYPSENPNMVLAVRDPNTSAYYMKINGEMMENNIIEERHLTDNAIKGMHIDDKSIEARHMGDESVENNALATGSVDGRALFKTHRSWQVLAVKGDPHADAEWTQVTTDMIERLAITPDKLFTSSFDHRVLAVEKGGEEAKYVLLTGDYIRDRSIQSEKLIENINLYGHPTIGDHPSDISDDHTIADTFWVNKVIKAALEDYTPTGSILNIPDHSVTGEKLFTTDEAPRVLGVDTPNGTPKYLQIVTEMIRNAAVTNNKIERDINLLGSPSIEVRPGPTYSDKNGFGHKIPDCQWVLDRILDKQKDFYDELKEKICCLRDIDPIKVRHDQIIVSPIESEKIPLMSEAVINGTRIPVGDTEAIDIDGETFESIPYHRIRDIIMNNAEPHESKIIRIGDNTVEPIQYYRINGLVNGTVDPILSGDGFEIDNEMLNGQICGYNCQDWNSKSFMVPIASRIVRQLINGTAEAVSTKSIEVYGKTIEPIPFSTIQDISSGRINITHGFEPVDINGETLEPIPIDRLRGLIMGTINPLAANPLDVTEYEEELEKETELKPGVIITEYLQDRAVTGSKLFTTSDPDCILGVLEGNSDPVWTKVNSNMLENRSVDGTKLFTSTENDRILGVLNAGDDPMWIQINETMLADGCVDTRHIRDNAITTSKIVDYAITAVKLARERMIETIHLFDYAVTNRKIADLSITNAKIENHTIEGIKLARRTEIPAYTYVEEHRDYEKRALRNTILSPRTPVGGHNGDIWLQFA